MEDWRGRGRLVYTRFLPSPSDLLSQNLQGQGLEACIFNPYCLLDSDTQPEALPF